MKAISLLIFLVAGQLLGQTQIEIFELPGAAFNDVSPDGQYVCGVLNFSQAFVWSQATGIINLTPNTNGEAFGVSNTGRVVGRMPDSNWTTPGGDVVIVPGYWEIDGSWHPIGNFPGIDPFDPYFFGNATSISADGTIIGGYGALPNWHPVAFRWSEADLFFDIKEDNEYQGTRALSLSADGEVLGGWISGPGIFWHPCIWNPDLLELGSFNPDFNQGDVFALNSDGTMAFGKAGGEFYSVAMYWTDSTGLVNLADTNLNYESKAWGGSDDGSIIGGEIGPFGNTEGFIWTPDAGRRSFTDWLRENGVKLGSNWHIFAVADISADGNVIIAWGDNTDTPQTISDGLVIVFDHPVSVDIPPSTPTEFKLEQNYPNPFNPSTMISYTIPEESEVKLTIFNMLGEEVAVLVNEVKEAGSYNISFNGAGLSSGIYVYRLKTRNHIATKKMILMK